MKKKISKKKEKTHSIEIRRILFLDIFKSSQKIFLFLNISKSQEKEKFFY